jgi:hypothetical protein
MSLGTVLVQLKDAATLLTRGSLPAPWKTFLGANGEPAPFSVAPMPDLTSRIVLNFRVYQLNYALICLAVGVLRVLLSPSLLFLSGSVVVLWGAFHAKAYEKIKCPEVIFFRFVGIATFLVLCLVGPVALSWSFGVGGSIALSHACLRNPSAHKNDDDEESEANDAEVLLEKGFSSSNSADDLKEGPFYSAEIADTEKELSDGGGGGGTTRKADEGKGLISAANSSEAMNNDSDL